MPSNERREGETVYEQPFVGDTSLPGTLPSNDSSINPYTEKGANGYYEISQGQDKVSKDVPLGKVNAYRELSFNCLLDTQFYD